MNQTANETRKSSAVSS